MEGGCRLLSQLDFINDNWNDEITLSKKVIETITNQLNDLDINDEDLF